MGLRIAALYDIHGNLPALEAVLEEDDVVSADVVVFGGDLVWGPWPAESLELAESLGERARFIRGNCETLVLDGASPPHAWARDRLSGEQRARVAQWPPTLTLGGILFCHATPRSDNELLTPDSLAGVAEQRVVVGHTHLQGVFSLAGKEIVNPGSVGAPTLRAVAWWALLEADVALRTTAYDIERTIDAASAIVPDVSGFANWLRHPPSYDERMAALAGT